MRKLFIAIVLLGLISFCPILSYSATINVPADQPTIQAGINVAFDGDTVMVFPGTFLENLNFGGKSIVVTAKAGPELTVLSPDDVYTYTVLMNSGEDSTAELSNFAITGGTGHAFYHIYIENSSPIIKNNIFHDNDPVFELISCVNSEAYIHHNIFYNNGGISCIGNREAGETSIINNTFDGNDRGFFTLDGGGTALNNIITASTDYGIYGVFTEQDYNNVWNNGENYSGSAIPGSHSLLVNPLYVDSAGHDYNLSGDSPCLHSGHPGPLYTDPDGTVNDMGALYRCTGEADSDGDGVTDCNDVCPGYDDNNDDDFDGIPDDCDSCPGFDDNIDNDWDDIPDDCDDCLNDPGNDPDSDGYCSLDDNCPTTYNPDQAENDGDGVGDSCDVCPGYDDNDDFDLDWTPDDCDNCYAVFNPAQEDADSDGVGDVCDECHGYDDNADADGDSLPDGCDNCPELSNSDQNDNDDDGQGDACDPDDDEDGIFDDGDGSLVIGDNPCTGGETSDCDDNCQFKYNPDQADDNGNGLGDLCEFCCDQPGDANDNSAVNILDVTYLIGYLYKDWAVPPCMYEGDTDGNCVINILDITRLIAYLYRSGPAPVCAAGCPGW